MNETYEILYHVDADQIEVGDQIIVDQELIEVTKVEDDPEAPLEGIRVTGYSNETGDLVIYDMHYSESVPVWSV